MDAELRKLHRKAKANLTPENAAKLRRLVEEYEKIAAGHRRGFAGHDIDPAVRKYIEDRIQRDSMYRKAIEIRDVLRQTEGAREYYQQVLRRGDNPQVVSKTEVPPGGGRPVSVAEGVRGGEPLEDATRALVHAKKNLFSRPSSLLGVSVTALDENHSLVVMRKGKKTLAWIEGPSGVVGEILTVETASRASVKETAKALLKSGIDTLAKPDILNKVLKGLKVAGLVLFVYESILTIKEIADPRTPLRMLELYARMILKPDLFTVAEWMYEMQRLAGPFHALAGYIFYAQIVNSEELAEQLSQIDPRKRREVYERIMEAVRIAREQIQNGTFHPESDENEDDEVAETETGQSTEVEEPREASPPPRAAVPPAPPPEPPKPKLSYPSLTQEDIRRAIQNEERSIEEYRAAQADYEASLRKYRADKKRYPNNASTEWLIEEYERRWRVYQEMIERAQARIQEYVRALEEPGREKGDVRPAQTQPPVPRERPADAVAGDQTRSRIRKIRERLRDLERWLREAEPWMTDVIKTIKQIIAENQAELDRERSYAEDLGQDTGESEDEPLLPPPPPPLPRRTVTYVVPVETYFNPVTGEVDQFPSGQPPSSDWKPLPLGPGEPAIRWGWVPVTDPQTGKRTWRPGWVPADRYKPFPGTEQALMWSKRLDTSLLENWALVMAAPRWGIDIGGVAARFGINPTRPLVDHTSGLGRSELLAFAESVAGAARETQRLHEASRGSMIWLPFTNPELDKLRREGRFPPSA